MWTADLCADPARRSLESLPAFPARDPEEFLRHDYDPSIEFQFPRKPVPLMWRAGCIAPLPAFLQDDSAQCATIMQEYSHADRVIWRQIPLAKSKLGVSGGHRPQS